MAKYISALLLLLIFNLTFGQSPQSDTAFISASVVNTKNVYSRVMKEQVYLNNGGDYIDYRPLKDEHPYFISNDWITGSIGYNGERYDSVSLMYNIHSDQVISEQFSSFIMIELVRDKIQFFSIYGHDFVMLQEKTIPYGFYDQLYKGKTSLYAKRYKEFIETISAAQMQRSFLEKSKYYINKDGNYYLVKSKKSVIQVLSDRKKELKQFIRKNHIRFWENREGALIRLTEFYNGN
ncbi:MAG TPA: hypothetical protein PLJ60_17480 [Chryseolinea sp.]|nr:hypothetical protein [Chryseolinea sp.]HPH45553.1 hypothetical protein [Chryseolinea sp.]HPM32128.1 hypothetical protein [Chryseolinea sp.]